MELPAEWVQTSRQNQANGGITLVLEPVNETFQQKRLTLAEGSSIKIGRMTNKSTTPTDSNGYFDSKVLSRNHAEVTYRNCQVYIKDLKSSNGTFINGKRLSAEGKESSPVELKHGDDLEFGVDIVNEQDKKLMFRKVAAKVSIKRRGNRVPSNTENSLLTMLEAELERARAESRYLSELGSMLNDATNTLDARSKRVSSSDKVMDLRFCEESHVKLEEAQIKLRETEAKLNEAIFIQKEYKDKFMETDKKVIELKERYMNSEKKVIELEQKCTTSEELINELEKTCMASGERVIQLEKKCKESDQKAIELEGKCRESELRIKFLENALQSTFNHPTKTGQFDYLEERLIKITNELSDNKYFLDDTRDQLERTEKELHASQKKCREFQIYETKYNEAMKTIEELRSFEAVASFRNQIGMRDEAFEKFDGERTALLSRIQFLEEAGKKSEAESTILREQLKKLESLNKNLKEEIESVEQFVNTSQRGLLRRRHKKQDSEPVKEWQMTDDHGVLSFAENLTSNDKMANMKYNKSLLIKGSIGVVVLGIGAWCFSRLYS